MDTALADKLYQMSASGIHSLQMHYTQPTRLKRKTRLQQYPRKYMQLAISAATHS
jgi:hypothetical protein